MCVRPLDSRSHAYQNSLTGLQRNCRDLGSLRCGGTSCSATQKYSLPIRPIQVGLADLGARGGWEAGSLVLLWIHLASLGFIRAHTNSKRRCLHFNTIEPNVSGLIWARFGSLGLTWVYCNSIDITWTCVDSLGLTWIDSESFYCIWIHLTSP